MNLIGQRFNHRHAAGVTRYQIDREHRDIGYVECVAIRGVTGTHHFIGSIHVFSRIEVEQAIDAEVEELSLNERRPVFDEEQPTLHAWWCPCVHCVAVRLNG
jgi:hypothetical protein